MPVKSVQSLGWTRHSAGVSVLLVLEEQRKRAGAKVVELREAKGWSQEDLARIAKLSTKTVSRFENGKHEGRRATVTAIAKALGVNDADVIGPPPAPLGMGETQLDRLEARINAIYDGMLAAGLITVTEPDEPDEDPDRVLPPLRSTGGHAPEGPGRRKPDQRRQRSSG